MDRLDEALTALNAEAPVDRWIGFVGDICPLRRRVAVYDAAILSFFAPCDLVVGNLEGVVTERRQRPFLHKHTPAVFDALEALAPAERWVLSVANAVDYEEEALFETLRHVETRGRATRPSTDRRPLICSPSQTATARCSAWTWWVNGTTRALARQDPGVPAEPGLHIAYPHWGYEHSLTNICVPPPKNASQPISARCPGWPISNRVPTTRNAFRMN